MARYVRFIFKFITLNPKRNKPMEVNRSIKNDVSSGLFGTFNHGSSKAGGQCGQNTYGCKVAVGQRSPHLPQVTGHTVRDMSSSLHATDWANWHG